MRISSGGRLGRWGGLGVPVLLLLPVVILSCSRDPQTVSGGYLESGDVYAARQQYREALIEYRNAVKHLPESGEAVATTYLDGGPPQSVDRR